MTKPKKLDAETVIKQLTEQHGLDYLNARNLVYGREEISLQEYENIIKRLEESDKAKLRPIKHRTTRARQKNKRSIVTCEGIYEETKEYVVQLAE